VGTPGSSGRRCAVVVTSARNRPALTLPINAVTLLQLNWTSLDSTAAVASPPPL
jgi:hypothetical protein